MRAALVEEDGSFAVATVADPVPGPGDLIVRVTGCGICGSDLKSRPLMAPGTVMGHEYAGEVVAVGPATEGWQVGMRAAVLPVLSCGSCEWCRAGDVAHCASATLVGLGGAPGGFAELVRARAGLSFALPTSLPPAWGPLVEPFAVGLHAARAAGIAPGDDVLVVGGGPVGLTTARWARELGARRVTVSDPAPARRRTAAALAATDVVDPATGELGGPYDVVVECVGRPGLLDACVAAAAVHGRIVVAGVCMEPDPYLPVAALMKELSVRFAVYYRPQEFVEVVGAFASGRIDPGPLVTRTVGLDQLDEAFRSLTGPTGDVKIVVDPTVAGGNAD